MFWMATFNSGALFFAASTAARALEHRIYVHDDSDTDAFVEEDLIAGLRNTHAFDDGQYFNAYSQKRRCEQRCSSLMSRCTEIEREEFVCEMDSSLLIIIIASGVLAGILVPTFFISLYICGFYSYLTQIMSGNYKCDGEMESLQGRTRKRGSDTNISMNFAINDDNTERKILPQSTTSVMEKTKKQIIRGGTDDQLRTSLLPELHYSVDVGERSKEMVDIL
uniref:Uncharacterized protein n=1 Tax=Parascaris univalens TaxID=6257 RepID=A0A915BUR9_PARUN